MGGRDSSSSTGNSVMRRAMRQAENEFASLYADWDSSESIGKRIPGWVARQNNVRHGSTHMTIEHETAKAFLVNNNMSSFGGRDTKFWVAKSVLQSPSQTKQEIIEDRANRQVSMGYTSYLKNLASTNGVKVGNLGSWQKIIEKLRKNGVPVMNRKAYGDSAG